MEILQLILVAFVFIAFAVLMFLRKLPALLALPIIAFLIPLIAGVAPFDIVQMVIGAGSTKLSEAYTIAIFGSMLSIMMQKTGVAERFIKMGAELSGDKPWTISLVMLLLITLLFSTLGGLGAIIMVSTVVLPILTSVGVGAVTTVGIFLIGLSLGGILNVGNWAVYTTTLGLDSGEVRGFASIMFVIMFIISIAYITIQLYRDGHDINIKKIVFIALVIFALISVVAWFYNGLDIQQKDHIHFLSLEVGYYLKLAITVFLIGLFGYSIYRIFNGSNEKGLFWGSFLIPIVPLVLIMVFNLNFIAGFVVGLIYGFLSTYKGNSLNILVRSILEGGGVVMPAVALMMGIGMLLNAVMGPGAEALAQKYPNGWPVLNLLKPALVAIIPTNAMSYILIFTIAAPLALYRGPLNVWGMGYGFAAILLASGMPPGAIMGILMAVGQIQGISDPTNTQNVWLANEMRVDVQKILWNTLPYTWAAALFGMLAAAFYYM